MIKSYNSFLLLEFNDIRNKIDLQKEYDRLNKELFDGKLIQIPLKWEHIKKHGGCVTYNQNIVNGKIVNSDIALSMSDFYDYTYDMFINAFAHELIHVFITQNNIKDTSSHGIIFQKNMEEINKKGYNIVVQMDVTDVPLTKTTKLTNPVCAILLEDDKGEKSITVYDYKLYNQDFIDKIIKTMKRVSIIYHRKYKIWFIYTYNREVQKYSIKRTLKVFQAAEASENIWNQLMGDEDNKILYQTEIN